MINIFMLKRIPVKTIFEGEGWGEVGEGGGAFLFH